MKFRWFLGVAATSILAATGSAGAVTIGVVSDSVWAGNDVSPGGFSSDLGSDATANHRVGGDFTAGGVTYTFTSPGVTPFSGEYDGNVTNQFSSPFGSNDGNRDYAVAEGSGGSVTVSWSTPQSLLLLLWGTVDTDPLRNVITFWSGANGTGTIVGTVDGSQVAAAGGITNRWHRRCACEDRGIDFRKCSFFGRRFPCLRVRLECSSAGSNRGGRTAWSGVRRRWLSRIGAETTTEICLIGSALEYEPGRCPGFFYAELSVDFQGAENFRGLCGIAWVTCTA